MIRIIIVTIVALIFFILSIPVLLVEWVIGKFNPSAKERSCLAIVKFGLNIVIFLSGCKPKIIGLENVPKDEAVLYIANHRSFFDIIITYTLVPGPTGYISKKENRVPIIAQYMGNMHGLFLDRKDIRQGMSVILKAIEYVKSGVSMFIFPEGTRSKTGELLPFKEGSFKIASKSGCKVVPIAITGSAAIFEDHFPKLTPGEVIVEYGKPFLISDLSAEDQKFPGKYTHDLIAGMLEEHKKMQG